MRSRYNIWIIFLGIIVAILCYFYSSKQMHHYSDLGKIEIKLNNIEMMASKKPTK